MTEHEDKQREPAEEAKQREHAEREAKAKAAKTPEAEKPEAEATPEAEEDFGATTKDDGTDAGVPMLPGSPGEPQGPEDAFGEGQKRGDYADRVGTNQHAESVAIEGGGQPVYGGEDGEEIVDFTPRSKLVSQNERVDEVGDEAGEKGGVTTTA